jgi:hypothetical protein
VKVLGTRLLIFLLALVWPLCVLAVELLELVGRVLRSNWKIHYAAFWREFKAGRFR